MIRALVLYPHGHAQVVLVEPRTAAYQNIIGGYVARLTLDDDPVKFYHNPTALQAVPTVELRAKLDGRTLHLRGVVVVVGAVDGRDTDIPTDVLTGLLGNNSPDFPPVRYGKGAGT